MDQALVAKSVFLAVPLLLLGLKLVPLRWALRIPVALVGAFVLALIISNLLPSGKLSYLVSFSIMAGIYAILTLGLNTQWGFTGHLNFGIAGFFAVGAFTSALFTTAAPTGVMAQYTQQAFGFEAPFLIGILAAAIVSGFVAFLIAIPVLRLRMDFLAIATIGIAEIIRLIFQNERWLANGPQPLRGIPRPLHCLFDEPSCAPGPLATLLQPLEPRDYIYFYLCVVTVLLALTYLLVETATRSPWGRVLRAVRDEEQSAAMNGKNITSFRIQSFVVGAAVMGLGGGLYAHYAVTIDYSHFNPLFATFIVWVMLMLGGSGNNKGAILGAFIIWGVWSGTAFLTGMIEPTLAQISQDLPARSAYLRWLLVAILLAGIVLYRPQGLIAEEKVVSRFLAKTGIGRGRRKQAREEEAETAS
ncbi:branched-chain amino acid ABC transporter permease [Ferruginivarius sediminum]|uniref:Branched-chain amino acid ABC transporter permease n=1 Tax=Ferruginivarius sediminum TaxID=2661937 RepID=A0A369TJR7_9PROT|nr:branched-chain amino acid ABC transporter permease [Ferruginivarius sediminum]RDD63146.1 branched-chain amino acid ABC transporter permease [Ferruginivarius sediminum]